MPAKLEKPLQRIVKIYGVEGPVVLTVHPDGSLGFKAKGTKVGLLIGGVQVVQACPVPNNLPAKFGGRPYEFLQYQAQEQQKRNTKKLQGKIAKEIEEENR
jgi:hypothetical protein